MDYYLRTGKIEALVHELYRKPEPPLKWEQVVFSLTELDHDVHVGHHQNTGRDSAGEGDDDGRSIESAAGIVAILWQRTSEKTVPSACKSDGIWVVSIYRPGNRETSDSSRGRP